MQVVMSFYLFLLAAGGASYKMEDLVLKSEWRIRCCRLCGSPGN